MVVGGRCGRIVVARVVGGTGCMNKFARPSAHGVSDDPPAQNCDTCVTPGATKSILEMFVDFGTAIFVSVFASMCCSFCLAFLDT